MSCEIIITPSSDSYLTVKSTNSCIIFTLYCGKRLLKGWLNYNKYLVKLLCQRLNAQHNSILFSFKAIFSFIYYQTVYFGFFAASDKRFVFISCAKDSVKAIDLFEWINAFSNYKHGGKGLMSCAITLVWTEYTDTVRHKCWQAETISSTTEQLVVVHHFYLFLFFLFLVL